MHLAYVNHQKLISIVFVSAFWGGANAQAQFLEKLEAAVRSQLESSAQQPAQKSTEELPAPNAARPTPQTEKPLSSIPSILESGTPGIPLTPAPVPDDQPQPPAGPIWLGLEVEGVVGGGLGLRVSHITPDSPAWKAGFEVGDRIQAVDGTAIANIDDMAAQLAPAVPGQVVRFLVSRGGRNIQLTCVLMDAELAARIAMGSDSVEAVAEGEPAWLGILVNDLTPSFRQQFGISVFRGAAVTNVVPGSPADKAGIHAGDAIIEAAGQPISSAADMMRWMETVRPGDLVQFMVARGFSVQPVSLTMQANPKEKGPIRFGNRRATPRNPATELGQPEPPGTGPLTIPSQQTANKPDLVEPSDAISAREQELEREVVELRGQLQAANRRLAETEKKLAEIISALQRQPE
ncbi:MAG: PDZ domain-containing protein [Pirellulaceae bacterium]